MGRGFNPCRPSRPSYDSVNNLKRGKCDAALIGRELTSDELKGLQDYTIAYDAVCIILDTKLFREGNTWVTAT